MYSRSQYGQIDRYWCITIRVLRTHFGAHKEYAMFLSGSYVPNLNTSACTAHTEDLFTSRLLSSFRRDSGIHATVFRNPR